MLLGSEKTFGWVSGLVGPLLCVVLLVGCGGVQQRTLSPEQRAALDDRAATAMADLDGESRARPIQKKRKRRTAKKNKVRVQAPGGLVDVLPPPSSDVLWGDGDGLTLFEAVKKAQLNVAGQVSSRISGQTDIFVEEGDKRVFEQAEVRIQTSSDFKYNELLRTSGYTKSSDGFVARVVLNKAEAIAAYEADLKGDENGIRRLLPALRRAIEARDTSVLLQTEWSPEALLARQRHRAHVISGLGKPTQITVNKKLMNVSKRAALMRSQAVIVLRTDGDGSPALRRAVVGEIGRLLKARGCRFQMAAKSVTGDRPVARAHLRLATSDSREVGVLFRALGFELNITDARSGSPVFHYSGLPEVAHGGGTSPELAEQGLIARLREKLDKKVAPAFTALTCR